MSNRKKLFKAIESNKYYKVKKILTANPELVKAANKDGETPLHVAARNHGRDEDNNLDIAEFLIENGADINAKDKDGNTSLHVAVKYNDLDIAELLIEKGADVNAKDSDGKTPLQLAVDYDYFDVAELIVDNIAQREAAGLPVDEQNLRLKSECISSSQELHNSYLQYFQECKEEVKKLKKENLIKFLKEGESVWVEDENVRNALGDKKLKEKYPKYANVLIHKANEVKKEIFLHNHEPLIDPLLKLCGRNFNNMTFHDMAAFCNNKDLVIDNLNPPLKLPLTNVIDFGDINAKHTASLTVQTFAKIAKISTAKTAKIYTIRIEKSKNAGTALTGVNTENVKEKQQDTVSCCSIQ